MMSAVTAIYGRPFDTTRLDAETVTCLRNLRAHHPALVHQEADGSWWLGCEVSHAEADSVHEIASTPGGQWLVGAEDRDGTPAVVRLRACPQTLAKQNVDFFLDLLPEELACHPKLSPLGPWLIQAA